MNGRAFWTNLTIETWAPLTAAICTILQIPLEPALWLRWAPGEIPRSLCGWTAVSLLALAPVSGLLVERYLVRRVPPGTSVRLPVRAVLFLGGCVPWLGVPLIPLWRRLMTHAPSWALRSTAGRLDLEGPSARLPRGSQLHRVYTSGAFGVWLTATGVLLWFTGDFWLAAGKDRPAILLACVFLHLTQAACMALQAESELRFTDQPRRFLRLVPWLCLVPQPVPTIVMLSTVWPVLEGARGKTLTWSAYARLGGIKRLPLWIDLQRALQQRWNSSSWIERWLLPRGLEIPRQEGRAEAARRTWRRAKSLLLPIEASLMIGWLVVQTGDPPLQTWFLAAVALAALGLLQAVAAGLLPLLRLRTSAPLGPSAAGLYLFVTQTELAFALLAGPLAVHGRFRELALVTVVSAILAAMLSVLLMLSDHLISQSSLSLATLASWPASFLLLAVPPVVLARRPDLAPAGLGLTFLVPLLDIALGVWSLPWLLYPFRWRDVFDRKIAARDRARLSFLALSALLPLGGLTLPGWALLREETS
jgi:hypothetical protein